MVHTVLILSQLKVACGNLSTVERIRQFLDGSWKCLLKDVTEFDDSTALLQFARDNNVEAAIGLHAFKAGRLLIGAGLPFIIILGGTDINDCCYDANKLSIMTQAVNEARYIVGFSSAMTNQAQKLWPELTNQKLQIIPQAVISKPGVTFDLLHYLRERSLIQSEVDPYIFLMVAGIRQVKDPLYLLDAFSAWHSVQPDVFLVIIGPELEKDLTHKLKSLINTRCRGVVYIGAWPLETAHACIAQSYALVNSARSEGMSVSILEALQMGTPVIARNIPGNSAVITHGTTGLLFNEPQDFVDCARELMANKDLYERLSSNGRQLIASNHSCQTEGSSYHQLLSDIIS